MRGRQGVGAFLPESLGGGQVVLSGLITFWAGNLLSSFSHWVTFRKSPSEDFTRKKRRCSQH